MRKLLLFIFGLSIYQFSTGQDVPDPDFSLRPYYLLEGKLLDFEKADASFEKKIKALGYGGAEIYYSVNGQKSTVRLNQNSTLKIIIKLEDNSDHAERFHICIGELKKSNRKFASFHYSTLGGFKPIIEKRIQLTSRKIRDKVFELSLEKPLPTGEYAIFSYSTEDLGVAINSGARIACFGID
ncbi:MAG: hypothetical protein ACK5WF_20540 [Cyclobacteriaceae bacterium]|jgi:hypothetical protein